MYSSLAMRTEWQKGNALTNAAKPPVNVEIGINTPPKMPAKETKMELIGPVCFSLPQMTPRSVPKER